MPHDECRKNIVSSLEYSAFAMSKLRTEVKKLHLALCEQSKEYEPIKDIYKKSCVGYKTSGSNAQIGAQGADHSSIRGKTYEQSCIFTISKDTLIRVITNFIEQALK